MSIRTAEDFDALVARIKEQDREVKAWRAFSGNSALKAARIGEFDHAPRPLEGLTVGVKDIIDVAGLPTRYGSPLFENAPPAARDAAVVAKMREAGAIIVGKTVTTELATFVPAETRNPRDLTRTPGGSSSGSAAAVAAGHVDIAIGTQTAGSIIRPAAYCGVYGFKPSFGLVPTDGVLVQCPSFDTVGVFARSLTHIEAWMRSVGSPPTLHQTLDAQSILVLAPSHRPETSDASTWDTFEADVEVLLHLGANVLRIDLLQQLHIVSLAHRVVQSFEAARAYAHLRQAPQLMNPALFSTIEDGLRLQEADYSAARTQLHAVDEMVSALLRDGAILALPSTTEPPPRVSDSTGTPEANRFASALGLPCLTVPSTANQWAGLQLMSARQLDDFMLSRAARLTAPNSCVRPITTYLETN